MPNGVPSTHLALLNAWKAPQVGLPSVIRWKKYLEKDGGARTQDSLQHSHSITLLGAIVMQQLRPYVQLDEGFLMTALTVHDIGEGEIGKDTLYIDKSATIDLQEYRAFRRCYEPLGKTFDGLHRAFLLQFAIRNPEVFPEDARRIMGDLAKNHRFDALAFDAIERWDYLLFALEQHYERKNAKILVQVLRGQIPHFERLADELPGFGSTIWTRSMTCWSNDMLQAHEGRWIEQKGEV